MVLSNLLAQIFHLRQVHNFHYLTKQKQQLCLRLAGNIDFLFKYNFFRVRRLRSNLHPSSNHPLPEYGVVCNKEIQIYIQEVIMDNIFKI